MVVGNVQSGKTANYLGFICKAAEAGYKLIIVIAGMLEDLISQTQERLEVSKQYSIVPAYNKGPYMVVAKEDLKTAGKKV